MASVTVVPMAIMSRASSPDPVGDIGVGEEFEVTGRVTVRGDVHGSSTPGALVEPLVEPAHLLRTAAVRPVEAAGEPVVVHLETNGEHVISSEKPCQRTKVELVRRRHEHHGVAGLLVRTHRFEHPGAQPIGEHAAGEDVGLGLHLDECRGPRTRPTHSPP